MSVVARFFDEVPAGSRDLLIEALKEGSYSNYKQILDSTDIPEGSQKPAPCAAFAERRMLSNRRSDAYA